MIRTPLFTPSILSLLILILFFHSADAGEFDPRAVVKIFVTISPGNPDRPWAPDPPYEASGTGFVIGGKRILTNAHVIECATYIAVKRGGDTRQYRADVRFVSDESDMAILIPEDPAFFEGIRPLRLGSDPRVRDEVTVVGYPIGGEELSYSSGIVSRIEVNAYAHSWTPLLTVQVDAAINPGNSGGPALIDDHVVGIAMMGTRGADGVGYLVPPVIIQHFLDDIDDQRVDGHPLPGIHTMALENRMQREYYGLDPDGDLGILVVDVDFEYALLSGLQAGDIIMEIDGVLVQANGKVKMGDDLVFYTHLFALRQAGEPMQIGILRDGAPRLLRFAAAATASLVPYRYFQRDYPYVMFGGLIFAPLYYDFIRTYGDSWPDASLFAYCDGRLRTHEKRQIVFLHTILKHETTVDLPLRWNVVRSVNGEPVRDFAHFIRLLDDARGWFDIVFESEAVLRLRAEDCRAAQRGIAETYGIPLPKPDAAIAKSVPPSQ
ncbi:MAG: trypsin-like peptidase domain-containing protein [Bacteroidetes bacterium]|nr:trypsin-like peptidase domain-containing protein [Bacteroidota bacterium]